MRFTITPEGADRLGLDPAKACRTFDGFSTREGLLGGVPRGVLKWAKRQLKIDRVEMLDAADARLLYYVIAIKNVDHEVLPIARFDDLALTDFELIKHEMTAKDQDGDCAECNQPLDAPVHTNRDDDGAAEQARPTRAPGGPETTETATP